MYKIFTTKTPDITIKVYAAIVKPLNLYSSALTITAIKESLKQAYE